MVSSPEMKGDSWIRALLGLGFWIQGLRGMPWMAVTYFLKDGLKVDPSKIQLLQNSANLPMVAKPLYGILSDAVYIKGQHRIPYIAIGALLQAVSWLALAILTPSSIFTISLYLLLGNFGASIVEVANDAIVAETGKQPSSSGVIQSFVSMASSAGGIIGNLLGGVAVARFAPQSMFLLFALLLSLQFFITLTIHESSLNLPKNKNEEGMRKQFFDLVLALRKPEIAYSIGWFFASYAIIPALTGTMFFYQTQYLKIETSVLGISKVFGQVALLLWSAIYSKKLKSVPPRRLISMIQATMAVFMVSDALFVKQFYQKMGVPDSVYVVVFSGFLEVLFFFKILPFSVLMAQLCPPGCEGSLMAFVMSAVALAFIVSGYLGVALASIVGVTGNEFFGLSRGLLIQAACTLLPLFWSSYIYDDTKSKVKSKKEE